MIGETGLTAEFMGGDSPELRARFVGTIPLGRMSQPRDIAAALSLLLGAYGVVAGVSTNSAPQRSATMASGAIIRTRQTAEVDQYSDLKE